MGEEYIAYIANKKLSGKTLTPQQQTIWQQFIDFINRMVQKVLNSSVKLTEADVLNVARAAIQTNFQGNEQAEAKANDQIRRNIIAAGIADAAAQTQHTTTPVSAGNLIFNPSQSRKQDSGGELAVNPNSTAAMFMAKPFSKESRIVDTPLGKKLELGSTDRALEELADTFRRWKFLESEIVKRGGQVPNWASVYLHATHTSSINGYYIQDVFQKEHWEPLLNVLAEIESTANIDQQGIIKYVMAKHAPYVNERIALRKDPEAELTGEEAYAGSIDGQLLTNEYAAEIVDRYEAVLGSELTDKLWERINSVNNFTLDKYVEGGFMTRKRADDMKAESPYYVPLRGWKGDAMADIFEYVNNDVNRGFQSPLIKQEGRTSEADNPFAYMITMSESSVMAATKNKLRQKALNLARVNRDVAKDLIDLKQIFLVDTQQVDTDGNKIMRESVIKNGKVFYIEEYMPDGEHKMVYAGELAEIQEKGLLSREISTGHYRRNSTSQAAQHEIVVFEGGRPYWQVQLRASWLTHIKPITKK